MMKAKQQGFTLLELLVVITLLAVLSVGALVAYEGIGENASNVSAANNIKTADSAIRAFRAVENRYPNQWDNLANLGGEVGNTAGGAYSVLAPVTRTFFGQAVGLTAANAAAAMTSLARVGVSEFQTLRTTSILPTGLAPNEFFNESAPGVTVPADEIEVELNPDGSLDQINQATFAMSIVPSGGAGGTCTYGAINLANNFEGATEPTVAGLGASTKLNRINDALDSDGCHLVFALGFGKDVPGTTLGSRVAISTAPTYTNGTVINPANNYARYIALFHVGSANEDGATPNEVTAADIFPRARLLAVVDTEGRNIDTAIAGAFAN